MSTFTRHRETRGTRSIGPGGRLRGLFLLLLALPAWSHAALIPFARHSSISGNGTYMPASSVESTDLGAEFNESFFQQIHDGGYNEYYQVAQRSTVDSSGFSYSMTLSGDATSGDFFSTFADSVFTLQFYVDVPSVMVLSGEFSRAPKASVNFVESTGSSNQIARGVIYDYYGGTLPQTIELLPGFNYGMTIADEDSISSFFPKPAFSSSQWVTAVVVPTTTAVPEPAIAFSLLLGLASLAIVRHQARRSSRTL